jgi:hypothetical protein
VDRARQMLLVEFLFGQYLDELRTLCYQPLCVLATDFGRHLPSPLIAMLSASRGVA